MQAQAHAGFPLAGAGHHDVTVRWVVADQGDALVGAGKVQHRHQQRARQRIEETADPARPGKEVAAAEQHLIRLWLVRGLDVVEDGPRELDDFEAVEAVGELTIPLRLAVGLERGVQDHVDAAVVALDAVAEAQSAGGPLGGALRDAGFQATGVRGVEVYPIFVRAVARGLEAHLEEGDGPVDRHQRRAGGTMFDAAKRARAPGEGPPCLFAIDREGRVRRRRVGEFRLADKRPRTVLVARQGGPHADTVRPVAARCDGLERTLHGRGLPGLAAIDGDFERHLAAAPVHVREGHAPPLADLGEHRVGRGDRAAGRQPGLRRRRQGAAIRRLPGVVAADHELVPLDARRNAGQLQLVAMRPQLRTLSCAHPRPLAALGINVHPADGRTEAGVDALEEPGVARRRDPAHAIPQRNRGGFRARHVNEDLDLLRGRGDAAPARALGFAHSAVRVVEHRGGRLDLDGQLLLFRPEGEDRHEGHASLDLPDAVAEERPPRDRLGRFRELRRDRGQVHEQTARQQMPGQASIHVVSSLRAASSRDHVYPWDPCVGLGACAW